MGNRKKPKGEEADAINAYRDEYKDMMADIIARDQNEAKPPTTLDYVLTLAFVINDENCPFNWHVKNGSPLSKEFIADLFGADEWDVRDALYRHSGTLGLVAPPIQGPKTLKEAKKRLEIKFDMEPALTGAREFESINEMRGKLELDALLMLLNSGDKEKTKVIDEMQKHHEAIGKVATAVSSYLHGGTPEDRRRNLVQPLYYAPRIGQYAEDFWLHDRDFHIAASVGVGMNVNAGILSILLERIRLTGSNRATIIERIPRSHEQHEAIIEAVIAGSRSGIEKAVKAHFDSSNTDFGFCV
ncbi:FCD domain-containing protein [Bythopirellula goksoeyrii]|uniref:FCD domain protein n=1 Tax=Bythopirellula goksoeyrii TaxID=1400387 RepID=A0A5B9QIA4_9BACT|nr:FCD domain-containing protein [Bythopirellula goksoeyrii]QEG37709.1 FCD domain protein [Bythopirellula goksoeyrii]